MERAKWINTQTGNIKAGQLGFVFKANGYGMPDSIQYQTWMFQPEGSTEACYCDKIDFEIIHTRHAFTATVTERGFGIGQADEGIPGYTPVEGTFPTYEAAQAKAESMNIELGLSKMDSWEIVASTMQKPVTGVKKLVGKRS